MSVSMIFPSVDMIPLPVYNPAMETEGLLTIKEIAAVKNCTKGNVWKAMREGRLKFVELLGHRYAHKDIVDAWVPVHGGYRGRKKSPTPTQPGSEK